MVHDHLIFLLILSEAIELPPPMTTPPLPVACYYYSQFLSAGFPLIGEYEWAAADHRHDMGRSDPGSR